MAEEKISSIAFVAKWITKVVNAQNIAGVWKYVIQDRFVPVNEAALPYGLDHLDPATALKVLHGSSSVNLLQAYNGINLDLSVLAIDGGVFDKHFFFTDDEMAAALATTSAVAQGDSLLVLIPQD